MPTGSGPYAHVLVGTDGSATAGLAVRHAAQLARVCGAGMTIVSAYTHSAAGSSGELSPDEEWMTTDAAGAESHVAAAGEAARAEGVPDVRTRTEPGDPAAVVLDVAEEVGADVIVVGSRGMASPSRFLLGSVPNRVSHHARCDLVIVRTAD